MENPLDKLAKVREEHTFRGLPGWRGIIGLIVPSLNRVMEQEFHSALPEGIAVCTARYLCGKSEGTATIGAEQGTLSFKKIKEGVGIAARELSTIPRLGVVIFGCTSASSISEEGRGWDDELTSHIQQIVGVTTFSASMAILKGLKELKVTRISLVTPYGDFPNGDFLNRQMKDFLERNGIIVQSVHGFGLPGAYEISSLPLRERYQAVRSVAASSDSEATVLGCTALPTFDLIEHCEQDFKRPVVTSNQSCLWLALTQLGVRFQGSGLGTLLKRDS